MLATPRRHRRDQGIDVDGGPDAARAGDDQLGEHLDRLDAARIESPEGHATTLSEPPGTRQSRRAIRELPLREMIAFVTDPADGARTRPGNGVEEHDL